jgi:pantoate--beta-alanine ligase
MYPSPTVLKFDFGDLEHALEGKFRPGHFNGVGIIVSKLFHIIRPQIALFGQKDLQQVAIIQRLVRDLSFDIKLEIVPTRRESNGLAMSSRNVRLNAADRDKAQILYHSLEKAKSALLAGDQWHEIQAEIQRDFEKLTSAQLEYFELIDPETFISQSKFDRNQRSSICIAAFIGETRLIDNTSLIP